MEIRHIIEGDLIQVINNKESCFDLYLVDDIYISKNKMFVFMCYKVVLEAKEGLKKDSEDTTLIHEDSVIGVYKPITVRRK